MIRVVVVDDDFRIAGIHAAYVDKVDGFAAIAQAHTAAEAVAAVDRLRPDLLLLDLYLPDEHGLDLVARLRREGHPAADVIVITAAKDADSVRAANLSHLHEIGRVEIRLRYGSGGRPEHRYRWCRAGSADCAHRL
jgi:response regulator of citrate/malate metabolism